MSPNPSLFEPSASGENIHHHFMQVAINQAKLAESRREAPIGAVVVRNDTCTSTLGQQQFQVLSKAHNQVETKQDATAHAEILALRSAARLIGNWRLINCTLYTTIEPCPQCLAAAQAFRIQSIVYGAPDHRLGAITSRWHLLGDDMAADCACEVKQGTLTHQNQPLHPIHTIPTVVSGIEADECGNMMQNFFQTQRKRP